MKQVEVRKQLARARAGLYRFLGGLYIMEVDAETLANMKQMQFPTDCENPELAEAYACMAKSIADLKNKDLEDVAADYAKDISLVMRATGWLHSRMSPFIRIKNMRSADVLSRRLWLCMHCMDGSRAKICSAP